MIRLRLAARLARRELRRHPWRTLLAVTIMALPVMAAQGTVLMANANHAAGQVSGSLAGDGADLVTQHGELVSLVADGRVPKPIRMETTFTFYDWLVTPHGGLAGVTAIGAVPDSPRVRLQHGRLPRNDHEVLANAQALAATTAVIGGRVELARGDVYLKVVGQGVIRDLANRPAIVIGRSKQQAKWLTSILTVSTGSSSPSGTIENDLSWFAPGVDGRAAYDSATSQGWYTYDRGPNASTVSAIVASVGGGIGILAVIASVAFTIGSRRRLRALGMLSASGAAPADLAWTVVLEGLWCGVIAAVVATLTTYALWLSVGRMPWVDRLISSSLVDPPHPMMPAAIVGIALFCLLIGVLAAALPARTVARTPVLSALGGRRPLPKLRTRLPLGGLVTFAVGTGVITRGVFLGTRGHPLPDAVNVLAGLAVVFGGVAMAPAVIVVLGRFARRTKGAAKLALRGLSRDRTRNAAVVGAAAVALAIPVVAITQLAQGSHQRALTQPHHGNVTVYAQASALPGLERKVTQVIGDDVVTARVVDVPGAAADPNGWETAWTFVVVDPNEAQRFFGRSAIVAALRRGDAVNVDPVLGNPAVRSRAKTMPDAPGLYRSGTAPKVTTIRISADEIARDPRLESLIEVATSSAVLVPSAALAPGKVDQLQRSTELFRLKPITAAEATKLRALENVGPTLAEIRSEAASGQNTTNLALGEWSGQWQVPITTNRPGADHTRDLALAATGVATVFALLIVLVALALAAADGRDDERLFAAVGGPPALLRRKRTIEAGVLTFGAGLLGVGVGLIPTLSVLWAGRLDHSHQSLLDLPKAYYDLQVPVVDFVLLVGGVTAVVATVVWAIQVVGGLRPRRNLIVDDS